jgi:hypothetical protein
MAVVAWDVASLKVGGTEVISSTRGVTAVTGTFSGRVRFGTTQADSTGTGAGDLLLGNGIYIRARNQADGSWLPLLGLETTNVVNAFQPWTFGSTITAAGLVLTAASATGGAGLRLPHGAAPTSPTNGDIWTTTAGLYVRINGATVGPLS